MTSDVNATSLGHIDASSTHLSVVRPLGQVYILQETATYTAVEFYTIKMALLHVQTAKTMNSMRISPVFFEFDRIAGSLSALSGAFY